VREPQSIQASRESVAAMKRTPLVVVVLLGSTVAGAQPDAAEPAVPPEGPPSVEAEPPPVDPAPAARMMQPPPETPAPEPETGHRITVLFAPLRLVIPLVEFTAEYRVADKIGVSVTLGAGTREVSGAGTNVTGTELEGGLQGRYYVVGDFDHGMELGAELLEEYVKFDDVPAGLAVAAGGLTLGAFIGYKIATRIGFTFEAQVGARYLVVEPAVQGDTTLGSPPIDEKWLPLLHLNVGWSF